MTLLDWPNYLMSPCTCLSNGMCDKPIATSRPRDHQDGGSQDASENSIFPLWLKIETVIAFIAADRLGPRPDDRSFRGKVWKWRILAISVTAVVFETAQRAWSMCEETALAMRGPPKPVFPYNAYAGFDRIVLGRRR
ncbi:hypothetical protein [Rhizobium leguminosarum]|uniref:hypothetical protein n=1 Tax=Rhizobium leguminosarum TaxID=384 RepID=UPI0015C0F329|nr:hypothetical protein [Rhizobium leguminosarum]